MNHTKGIFYALLSSTTFGLIPLFSIPLLRAGMHSPSILVYRLGFAALSMGIAALLSRRSLRLKGRDVGVLLLLSLLYTATSFVLLCSYTFIPSGMATTIHFLYPLVVTIVMTLFFHERSSLWLVAAALVSVAGVALLSLGDGGGDRLGAGLLTAGATVVTYALYIVCMRESRAARMDPLVVAFYVLFFGTYMMLPVALCTTGIEAIRGGAAWMNVLLLALVPTVLSNLSLVVAVQRIGSTMTSILGSMEPLTAVVVGVFHFHETFTARSAVGLSLVVVAVIVVIVQSNRPPRRLRGIRTARG